MPCSEDYIRKWGTTLWDSSPEQHIGEPVLASALVRPRKPGWKQLTVDGVSKLLGLIIGAITGAVIGDTTGGGIHAVIGAAIGGGISAVISGVADDLLSKIRSKKDREAKLKLPEDMYMAVGPTTFGLYGLGEFLQPPVSFIVCPRSTIVDFRLGPGPKRYPNMLDLEVEFANGFVLELSGVRGQEGFEEFRSLTKQSIPEK